LYDENKSDSEIANKVGVTRSAIGRWRKIHDLPTNKLKTRYTNKRPSSKSSLCWGCQYAYASRCPWHATGQKIWKEAEEVFTGRGEDIGYKVINCEHFKIQTDRTNFSKVLPLDKMTTMISYRQEATKGIQVS